MATAPDSSASTTEHPVASAAKFLDMLAVPTDQRLLDHALGGAGVPAGTALPVPEPVFKKFEMPKSA